MLHDTRYEAKAHALAGSLVIGAKSKANRTRRYLKDSCGIEYRCIEFAGSDVVYKLAVSAVVVSEDVNVCAVLNVDSHNNYLSFALWALFLFYRRSMPAISR
jgi:hypothetical protein